jgi:hypothetical protein
MRKIITAVFAISLVAAAAFADHGGPGMGGPGFGPGGPEGGLVVGSDGTVYVPHTTVDTSTRTSTTTLTAIGANGATKWTATLTNAGRLVLSGSNLLTVSETRASDGTITSTLTAISTATGQTAWTKTINGAVGDLVPFNGGTYAVVVVPATASGGSATRSLVAFDASGNQLWSVTV